METLNVSRENGIVTVTLDRANRMNAMSSLMFDELTETFREIADNDDDRVVIVTGANGEFSSGFDLSPGSARSRHQLAAMRRVGDAALALHKLPQPTIAKVRGVAVGAGCNLALGCDLVVASDTARFSEIFSKRGLSVDFGGTWLLPRRVGMHKAKELAFFAEILGAGEAERIGLVNRVVPDAQLDEFVDGWAQRLAAGPPIALAMTKRLLNNSLNVTMEEALDDEGFAQTVNIAGTKDTTEAFIAFAEKRSPNFHGR
jgi:enoyl-CoA hydratase/carnithine racemase